MKGLASFLFGCALALMGCDEGSPAAQGPGTETETVRAVATDGSPLRGATVRQIDDADWIARRRAGGGVVLDSCTTDSSGACRILRRHGVVWEAQRGDSLLAWSEGTRLVLGRPALWTGTDSTGAHLFLGRTSIEARVGTAGVWAASAPTGTFPVFRATGSVLSRLGEAVLDTTTDSWDSTLSLGTTLSLMDPLGPFRLEWFATSLEAPSGRRIVDPLVPFRFDGSDPECVGNCPVLDVSRSPSSLPGLAARIRVGPHRVRIVGGQSLHVRMNSTAPFQTMVRGGGQDPAKGSVTWMPGITGMDPQWVVYTPTGGLDTLSLETTNAGILQVLDVQIRDSTGVKLSIYR